MENGPEWPMYRLVKRMAISIYIHPTSIPTKNVRLAGISAVLCSVGCPVGILISNEPCGGFTKR